MITPRPRGLRYAKSMFLLLCLGPGAVAALALNVRTDLGVSWVRNFSRTSAAGYEKDTSVYNVSIDVGRNLQLSSNWFLSVNGKAQTEAVPQYTGMNYLAIGPQAALRRKFGLGPFAPTLELNAGLFGARYRENGRSGTKMETGIRLAKRLTETWRISVAGDWEQYAAKRPSFDTHNHRLQLDTTWDFTERWQAGFGASRLWGQVVANATWDIYGKALGGRFGPAIQKYYRAIPWEVSNTFGRGWVAYRVDCHVDIWWLSLSPALSPNTSLPLRYESAKLINRVGVRYTSEILSLSLVHRF